MAAHWGYLLHNGPETWKAVAPAAKGLHQSPINIDTGAAEFDPALSAKPLIIKYLPENSQKILNNGHSFQVVVDGTDSLLEGGPLAHKYRLEQFHFHWGKTSGHGAEHLVNGKKHAAELHLVHWNTEICSSFAEAAKSANGLAVLGVFLNVGHHEHKELKKIVSLLPQVIHADDSVPIAGGFDPASLLPEDKSKYWTYSGSLTTPPCYESVRFIIFKEPITVSESQLDAFRELRSYKKDGRPEEKDKNHGRIVDNYRPTLPLNDRRVFCSFAEGIHL